MAILYMVKADILFLPPEKIVKTLKYIWQYLIAIPVCQILLSSFLECEKSNAKFLSHTFQYLKILESPNKHNVMTSLGLRLILGP